MYINGNQLSNNEVNILIKIKDIIFILYSTKNNFE
jgi:hypothetical protein